MTDVLFGIEYGSLNERLWSTFNTLLNVVQICAGLLALGGFLKPETANGWGRWAVVALAVISGLQLALDPLRRSVAFRDVRCQFQDLKKRLGTLTLVDADSAIEDIRKSAPIANRYLVTSAQNAVLVRHGHHRDKLSLLEWVIQFFA